MKKKTSILCAIGGVSLLLAGCSLFSSKTVTPPVVHSKAPSISSANISGIAVPNGGLLGYDGDLLVVIRLKIDQYEYLTAKWGKYRVPPVTQAQGAAFYGDFRDKQGILWTNTWSMTAEAQQSMDWMVSYDRQPAPP